MGADLDQRLTSLRDALPGQTLAGSGGRRYPLGRRLGEGGQGWIFRATWNGSVDVIVKVLRPDVVTKDALARFEREAAVLRTMSQQSAPNPHVVRYYDHATATLTVPGTQETWTFPFTVLEYVEGETLADTLAREQGRGLGVDRSRTILRHMVLALRDVHAQNIIHRDLKPSNVLIETRNGREIAKVTDFGLAKVFDDSLHRTAALAGATVGYAPPEQFEKGNPRVGKATDVFSLAAIVFEMFTGEPCFPFSDPLMVLHSLLQGNRPTFAKMRDRLPRELRNRADLVEALDAVLARALATAPGDRYPTVTHFQDAIEDSLATLAASATLRLSERPANLMSERMPRAHATGAGAGPVSGDAATQLGDPNNLSARYEAIVSAPGKDPSPARPASRPEPPHWQVTTTPVWPRPLRTLALSPDGKNAVGVGPDGLGVWNGRGWMRIDLPRFVAPATVEALAWFGNHLVVAGASSTLSLRSPDGNYTPITFAIPGLVFHGAYADAVGVILVGEQVAHGGPVGVIATMNLQQGGLLALGWVTTGHPSPLRAAVRLGTTIVACGDHGTVASFREGRITTAQLCPQPLLALAPAGDGAAIAVGGGGFVFHVTPTLEGRLDPVQTTRGLTAVTRGVDGVLYCGGEERRVLRREASGWARVGIPSGAGGTPSATVRALSANAGPGSVTAFCDDGSVIEGLASATPFSERGPRA